MGNSNSSRSDKVQQYANVTISMLESSGTTLCGFIECHVVQDVDISGLKVTLTGMKWISTMGRPEQQFPICKLNYKDRLTKTLSVGTHHIPFNFSLPLGCPPTVTYDSNNNTFRCKYWVSVLLEKDTWVSKDRVLCQQAVTVTSQDIRLNIVQWKRMLDSGFLMLKCSGLVDIQASVEKQRYSVGSRISLSLTIENRSNCEYRLAKIKLLEVGQFTGQSSSTRSWTLENNQSNLLFQTNSQKVNAIYSFVLPLNVLSQTVRSKEFSCEYILELKFESSAVFSPILRVPVQLTLIPKPSNDIRVALAVEEAASVNDVPVAVKLT